MPLEESPKSGSPKEVYLVVQCLDTDIIVNVIGIYYSHDKAKEVATAKQKETGRVKWVYGVINHPVVDAE
jgi:hypothetical protein